MESTESTISKRSLEDDLEFMRKRLRTTNTDLSESPVQKFRKFQRISILDYMEKKAKGSAVMSPDILMEIVRRVFPLSESATDLLFSKESPNPDFNIIWRDLRKRHSLYLIDQKNGTKNFLRMESNALNDNLIIAFALIANLAEKISQDNINHIIRRVKIMGMSLQKSSWIYMTEYKIRDLIDINLFDVMASRLKLLDGYTDIIGEILDCMEDTSLTAHQRIMAKQLCNVFSGYGLTDIDNMDHFTTIVTRAHTIDVVLTEAENFKAALAKFKKKYPIDWRLGRVFNLPDLEGLHAKNYPHLYTCAMHRSQSDGSESMQDYVMTNVEIRECRQKLQAWSLVDLTVDFVVTEEMAKRITQLTGNTVNVSCSTEGSKM